MIAGSSGSSSGGKADGQSVVANGVVICCVLHKAEFEKLLGPYEELWRYEALRKVTQFVLLHTLLPHVPLAYHVQML